MGREHKMRIENLKKDGYQVTGYLRKSSGKGDASMRLRLLDLMVDRLIKDSSMDMVFASYSSSSKQPFTDHDRTDPLRAPKTLGSTQGAIRR